MRKHMPPMRAIEIAAKMGFLTKEIWVDFVFKGKSLGGRYKGWRDLKDLGYFSPHPSRREETYILNKRKAPHLPFPPVDSPFAGQMEHDEILLRGALLREPFVDAWLSEAELKSMNLPCYRIGTASIGYKFPDALLTIGEDYVAIEVERTQKDAKRYKKIMTAYALARQIKGVVFVVGKSSIKDAVRHAAKEIAFPESKILSFMTIADWKNTTACAPFLRRGQEEAPLESAKH